MKRIIGLTLVLIILSISICYAEDNATSGGESTTGGRYGNNGFYRSSEYMWKVSVYIGKSDTLTTQDDLSDFEMLGNHPTYITKNSYTVPSALTIGRKNKIDYLTNNTLAPDYISSVDYISDDPPPPPVSHYGNISEVKNYFGDIDTVEMILNSFVEQRGLTSRTDLVSNISFTIEDETRTRTDEEIEEYILPNVVEENGVYKTTNAVPYVIIYEPVAIAHLKDGELLAFTATEFAIAQREGYFNFGNRTSGLHHGENAQYIPSLTFIDLPNSVILEESWFGHPVVSPSYTQWPLDRIIQSGGYGMRFLGANKIADEETETVYDYEYRTDTDVITSVTVSGGGADPDNPVSVTFDVNGQRYRVDNVYYPSGSSQLVWFEWRTPSEPQEIVIDVDVDGGGRSDKATIDVNIIELIENPPPDPTADDRNDDFEYSELPHNDEILRHEWTVWDPYWFPVWVEKHRGCHGEYETVDGKRKRTGTCHHTYWVDEGYWKFNKDEYYAELSADMLIMPNDKVPTANGKEMKSGYGFDEIVTYNLRSSSMSNIVKPQTAITWFDEFNFSTYYRVLEEQSGDFVFEENKYSTYNSRSHFTPIWMPDGEYRAYTYLFDCFTPCGMLRVNLTDSLEIQGNLWDDYHIAPKKVD